MVIKTGCFCVYKAYFFKKQLWIVWVKIETLAPFFKKAAANSSFVHVAVNSFDTNIINNLFLLLIY